MCDCHCCLGARAGSCREEPEAGMTSRVSSRKGGRTHSLRDAHELPRYSIGSIVASCYCALLLLQQIPMSISVCVVHSGKEEEHLIARVTRCTSAVLRLCFDTLGVLGLSLPCLVCTLCPHSRVSFTRADPSLPPPPSSHTELYSHHLSTACWAGARIIMAQTTFHAETIFDLLMATFSSEHDERQLADLDKHRERSGLGEEEWLGVVNYAAQVRI